MPADLIQAVVLISYARSKSDCPKLVADLLALAPTIRLLVEIVEVEWDSRERARPKPLTPTGTGLEYVTPVHHFGFVM